MKSKSKSDFFKPKIVTELPRARVEATVEEIKPVCRIFGTSAELIRQLIQQSSIIVDEDPFLNNSNKAKPPKLRRV